MSARPSYTDEFKADAVALADSSERSLPSVASELGVSLTALKRWVRLAREAENGSGGKPDDPVDPVKYKALTVFEDFVATALTEAMAGYAGMSSAQYETYMDELEPDRPGNRVLMKVDLVHAVDAVPAIVFDAKYKAATPWGQYPNADHYQMLAYCTALRVKRAWLVYAGPGEMETRHVRFTDKEIAIFPLDLSRSPQELLERVGDLAADAWRIFCQSERIAVEHVAH